MSAGEGSDDSRLGTSRMATRRLGTATDYDPADLVPELANVVRPKGPNSESPRSRLDAHMKPAFAHEAGTETNWDHLLTTLADAFDELGTTRDIVHVESFIDTASGAQLDKLGHLADVTRRTDESDSHFRMRIKLRFHALIRGPTVERIKRTAGLILGVPAADVGLDEPFETEPARFDISVPEPALDDDDVSVGEFQDLLLNIKPAGVRVLATTAGMFTHRSERDFLLGQNTQERAYDGLDADGYPMDIGGTYAGLLFDTNRETTLL